MNIKRNNFSEILDLINWDHTIGFRDLFDGISKSRGMAFTAAYPPYNIISKDGIHVIEIAAAGFNEDELKVSLEGKVLTISGSKNEKNSEENYVFRSLSSRDFSKSFTLVDNTEVTKVTYKQGIVRIELETKKEKPNLIQIPFTKE
jgi:molecular chaperone IbpA